MYKTIQSIFNSITSQQSSVIGCKLTVQTPDGEQISINVENVLLAEQEYRLLSSNYKSSLI